MEEGGGWDGGGRWPWFAMERSGQRMTSRERVLAALRLETTVMGTNPTAMINGRVLRVGDSINGFTVTAIAPQACKVCRDGAEFVLAMTK